MKLQEYINQIQKRNKLQQGITLTALVITILVLLILIGITMPLLLSDTGIFTTAQKGKDAQKIGEYLDRLVVAEASNAAETMINVTLDSYIGELKRDGLVKQDESNLERQDKLNAEIITEERYIFHIADKKGDIVYEYVGKEKDMAPRIKDIKVTSKSTNQIQIEIVVDRLNGGKLTYLYKKDTEPEKSYQELKKNTTDLTASFTGLEQNMLYNIKVVAENKNGKVEKVISEITGELPRGTISQKGETKWANERATIELETTATGYTLQYQINSREGTWKEYTGPISELKHGDTVYARLYDGNNASDTATVNIQDGTVPTVTVTKGNVTTNSIAVIVTSSDGQSGMLASPSYSYYIKKHSDSAYPTTASYTGTNASYTFTGLTQTTAYDVKVTTKDKANNLGTGSLSNITTETIGGADNGLLTGNITASPATWSNQKASITLSTTTGLTIQWQIGNITEGNWTTANGAGVNATVTGLSHGSVVYARLTDGVNVGDYGSVNIQDGTEPTVTVTKGNVTTNSITVSVTSSDGQSGMPTSPSYSYYIKKHSDSAYPTTASYTGTNASYTFTGLTQTTAYDVKVTTKDKANNLGTGTLASISTTKVGGGTAGLTTGNIIASSPTWSGGKASITLSTTTGLQIEWQIGNITEGKWTKGTSVTGLSHGSVVYARLTDGNNVGDYASVNIKDGTAPTVSVTKGNVTTNSITVSAKATDNQGGMPTSPSYSYYIKKHSDSSYPTTASYTGTNASYTFTGLTQTTAYDVKVTTKDKANNLGTGTLASISTTKVGGGTAGLITGNIIASSPTWSGGKASITLSTTTGLQIEWQIGNITEGKWTKGTSVTGLSHGSVVYARLTDGNNVGDYASVNIQDGTAPTVSVTKKSSNTNSIGVSVTSSDGQSGMPTSPSYSYYIKKHSDSAYPTTASYTGTNASYTFTGLTQTTAYDVKVTTKDKANNLGTGTLANISTTKVGGGTAGLSTGNIIASSPTWSGGKASITLSTTTGLTIEWQIGNITEGKWTKGTSVTGLSHGSVVYARLTDGNNVGDYASVNIQDGTAPTVSVTKKSSNTNSIGVSVTSSDGQSGMPTSPSYSYYIKKHSDSAYPTTASYTGTNVSYTFTGLMQTTVYDVKVTTKDKANNLGTGTLANISTTKVGGGTAGLSTGNIIASSPTWSSGKASITLSTNTGLQIEWQIGNITEGKWTKGTSVTGLSHGSVVYARLTDGNNVGDYASVNIADGLVPQNATISLSSTSVTAGTGITATVTHKDNESGIVIGSCKWVYNTTASAIGINPASYTGGTFSSNPQTITLNSSTVGTYYLHVLTTDVAGNKKETISSAVTVEGWVETTASDSEWYNYGTTVNAPKLGNGMIPIKYVGRETVTSKKWANARTTDGSLWVWIPRYAYQIASNWHTNSTSAGTVNIKFLQNTSNTATDGTTSWTNSSGQGNWNVHPAFSYGSEVSGIWVAKFEASQSNATSSSAGSSNIIKIQPGVQSWRSITINDIYSKSLSYNSTLNSHQMKNSEWGAVAYLAQSVYGKNSEVWINNSGSYITGSAGNSVSASQNTGTTNDYTSSQGVNASTTGNIYGIYDMSGGTCEYTAAYVNNGHANLNSYGASLVGGNAKTKDVYTSATSSGAYTRSADYETAKGKYGDAVYETSSSYSNSSGSWYGDYAYFPYMDYPFFMRGGDYSNSSGAGLLAFDCNGGFTSRSRFPPSARRTLS